MTKYEELKEQFSTLAVAKRLGTASKEQLEEYDKLLPQYVAAKNEHFPGFAPVKFVTKSGKPRKSKSGKEMMFHPERVSASLDIRDYLPNREMAYSDTKVAKAVHRGARRAVEEFVQKVLAKTVSRGSKTIEMRDVGLRVQTEAQKTKAAEREARKLQREALKRQAEQALAAAKAARAQAKAIKIR